MFKLFKNWYHDHFSQPGTVEFALVLITAFILVYFFMWLIGPLVVALCIAYVLDWAVEALMERFKLGRSSASIVVMLLFIGFAVLAMLLIVPQVIRQGAQFYNSMVALSQDAAAGSDEFTMSGKDLDAYLAMAIYNLVEELPDPLPTIMTKEDIAAAAASIRLQLVSYTANLMRTQLMPSVVNVFTYMMYLIIVPIFTFLMLRNKETLQKRMLTYILPNNKVLIKEFWPSISGQISGYIRGKVLHIIIIFIVNTLAFRAFSLNYAVLLGLGVGLSVVIPYVGAVIIAIPVLLVSVFQFGFTNSLLWLLLVYLIIQLLDSNVLTPMLFSRAMNLDAFSILAAILIFGGLWGFWGVFFAIPLATFIKTLIVRWPSAKRQRYRDERQRSMAAARLGADASTRSWPDAELKPGKGSGKDQGEQPGD